MKNPLAVALLSLVLVAPTVAAAAPAPLVCGDSNANGSVTSTDALSVLKKAVGQKSTVLCCGDGVRSDNEECEGSDLAGDSCVTRGYAGGTLRCGGGCTFDHSGCYKSRFEDLGLTVYDHETGLEWEKKDGDDGTQELKNPHDIDNLYVWGDAGDPFAPIGEAYIDFLARLNGSVDGQCYAGRCDWRLPTMDEWYSIVVPPVACIGVCLTFFDPSLEPMKEDAYWTAETNPEAPSEAMILLVGDGAFKSDVKKEVHFVRAVRTGLPSKP